VSFRIASRRLVLEATLERRLGLRLSAWAVRFTAAMVVFNGFPRNPAGFFTILELKA
jgi:hypothetical protein